MNYVVAFLILAAAIAVANCSEQNICHKYTTKKVMKYHKHQSRYGFGHHSTTYIVWYPVQHYEQISSKVCCDGYGGYVDGKGCLLRLPCSVSLHHKASAYCKGKRDLVLQHKRLYYVLNKPKEATDPTRTANDVLIPVLNQTAATVRTRAMFDPLEAEWFNTYFLATLKGVRAVYDQAVKTFGVQQFTSPAQFVQLKAYFEGGIKAINFPKIFYPTEYFLDTISTGEYLKDSYFASKALAGLNPTALKKVTADEANNGYKWSELKKHLNPNFDWAAAITACTGKSIEDSTTEGRLYVADLHLARDIPHIPDLTDRNRNDSRILRNETAPIALFGMKDVNGARVLHSIAMQIDYKPDSKVYQPSDGEAWNIAKLQFETVSSIVTQVGNHLTRTHLLMERVCVIGYRQFSHHHPFGQLLYPHCLGTIPVNSNGIPALVHELQITHVQWGIGNTGSIEIINRAFSEQHWDDYDFPNAIKRRGMDNANEVPYYPYRDDGMTIYHLMKRFAHEYVDLYYESDDDVKADAKLQAFANSLSLEGTNGDFAASGKVKGFPAKFDTVVELKEAITRILFIIPDHSAYNFPLAEFMNFVPDTPTKLYMDKNKELTAFESLGDSGLGAYQLMSTGLLASLHYDTLLSYALKMDDEKARTLVDKYYAELHQIVGPVIEKRIQSRLAKKELGYPYFLPKLMPNSIST